MPDAEFFRDIGRKGGQAGQGSEAKRRSAQAAANARWKKNRTRPVKLTVDGGNVYFSREVPGLERVVSAREAKRKDGSKVLEWKRVSMLDRHDGKVWVPTTLLHRVRKFLNDEGITFTLEWRTKPFHLQRGLKLDEPQALNDQNFRQKRVLKSVLKQPAGTLCRASLEDWNWLLVEILRITQPARAVLAVEEVERLNDLHSLLQHDLVDTVGLLTDQTVGAMLDQQRITIMTPAYVGKRIIPADECEILIFDRCPRTAFKQVQISLPNFPFAWRMARLDDAKRGHWRMLMAEAAFGEVVDVSGVLGTKS